MVSGESGIGKSSFAELFMKKFNVSEFLEKLEPPKIEARQFEVGPQ